MKKEDLYKQLEDYLDRLYNFIKRPFLALGLANIPSNGMGVMAAYKKIDEHGAEIWKKESSQIRTHISTWKSEVWTESKTKYSLPTCFGSMHVYILRDHKNKGSIKDMFMFPKTYRHIGAYSTPNEWEQTLDEAKIMGKEYIDFCEHMARCGACDYYDKCKYMTDIRHTFKLEEGNSNF